MIRKTEKMELVKVVTGVEWYCDKCGERITIDQRHGFECTIEMLQDDQTKRIDICPECAGVAFEILEKSGFKINNTAQ